ncbi:hypothetical protein [Streptomyces sp. BA2]|uniref:hypothetical protein n=1 Tax=Streptomyces sp. BA2 TaxID=436595 RepID=UPI0013258ADE|nr:hypothetical protein [Streptomyces sp. BA2]MWA13614.1 hypothetical protein [Streptomyces sp. BA2]
MSSHRRRTLLRSAAVTTVVGGALLMPAVAAVADTPAHAEAAQADGTRTVAPVAPGAPEGGVKAGTEGFHSGDPVFIAAGGAMAAAGAAGLGYAMLRRGRTDA